ncbi:trypco2 family protein [Kitasatospora sp. NPDC057015]|uniref:trypco2 family protein n=1 Tax=Kitasatospora sp. NPDC057015 TaxID=3346001 RepID=UPI003644FA25
MGGSNGTGEEWLDLADAITLLRGQVAEARDRLNRNGARESGVLFNLGEITLELGMELTRTKGGDGSLRFGVAGFGGKYEKANKATHKVTVRLEAHQIGGGSVEVSSRDD